MLDESRGPASANGDNRALKATVAASRFETCALITSPGATWLAATARAVVRGYRDRTTPWLRVLQPGRDSKEDVAKLRVPFALRSSVHACIETNDVEVTEACYPSNCPVQIKQRSDK